MSEFTASLVPGFPYAPTVPEVGGLDYDIWTLRITLHFEESPPAYLTFKDLSGFRVLREGDLLEYWSTARPNGWLWEVQSGGWMTSEAQRPGFISGNTRGIREFLVVGQTDCVSVLSSSAPEFSRIEP
jgi:hypothetical protein